MKVGKTSSIVTHAHNDKNNDHKNCKCNGNDNYYNNNKYNTNGSGSSIIEGGKNNF